MRQVPRYRVLADSLHFRTSLKEKGSNTVNSEICGIILFSRIARKDVFATFKIRDKGMIYLHQ